MEFWDAYDKSFNLVEGITLVRGDPVPEGLYHLVCNVLVTHVDGEMLIMQRDPRKTHGGMWEATAGGSALRGETPYDCAVRELKEETGIIAESLTLLGMDYAPDRIYANFICETDWDKTNITLQEGETVAFKWICRDELLAMHEDKLVSKRMLKYILTL